MLRIAIFELLQIGVSAFALWRGGPPERAVGAMLLLAAWITLGASAVPTGGFRTVEVYRLSVDLLLGLGLLGVALRANRWWPLWVVALHLVALGTHGVRAFDPVILPIVYSRITGEIAYPICLVLVIGTLHYRRRLRQQGVPPQPWSPFRW